MITELSRGRWLVSTTCHDCFVEIETFADEQYRAIDISLFSKHVGKWEQSLTGRLSRAGRALRGGTDEFIELLSATEMDELIEVLIEARIEAFGEVASDEGVTVPFGKG